MKITEFYLAELDREVNRSRHVLENVPDGQFDWKPHEKSMIFGYLADMVATIPSWIALQVLKDDLDIAPKEGKSMRGERKTTSKQLIEALDKSAEEARAALKGTTDEHLNTSWQLKAGGKVVQEAPRFEMIQDTFNHWSHHRGQLTVYLRLMGAKVAGTYGPSADEHAFR